MIQMKVSDLAKTDGFSGIVLPDADRKILSGYTGDLLSWVMGKAKSDDAWITIMSNINVLAVASLADVSCVVFAEGVLPDENIIEAAKAKQINLISSEKSAFDICCIINRLIGKNL